MIIEITVAVAMACIILAKLMAMAAEDTGLTVPDDKIHAGGGDPAIIHLTAYEGITPGDNVAPAGTQQVYQSDTGSSPVYMGTADLNDKAVLTGDETALTHDWAAGEVVPVITGHCHVRKIAGSSNATAGKVQRIGAADGAQVEDNASTAKYSVGRALTGDTSGNPILMNQWG